MNLRLSVVALILACLLSLGSVPQALGHATLTGSEPTDGAVVGESPHQLLLKFNEPVSPLVLRLIAADGGVDELEGAAWTGGELVVPLRKALSKGTHVLSWRVVSQDGHPIGGSIVFSVGERSTQLTTAEAPEAFGLRAVIWSLRMFLFLTLFVGVGGAAFSAWAVPEGIGSGSAETIIKITLWLVPLLAFLSVGVLGLDALGLNWEGLLTRRAWRAGLGTSYAITAVLAGAAAFLALASIMRPALSWRWLSFMAVVATGAALAASGHASTAPPQLVSKLAVTVHAISLTLWLGALIPLASTVSSDHPHCAVALRRFSRVIPWPIAALVASGIVSATLQLNAPSELISTAYGRILSSKLALVACLFALAGYNRYRLTDRVIAANTRAGRRLVGSITIELLLVLAILATVALWRFTPPPRAIATPGPEMAIHLHGQDVAAMAQLLPGKVGTNRMEVTLTGLDGKPTEAKEVRLSLTQPQAGIEPLRRDMASERAGKWTASDLVLPVPGPWMVRLDVLIDDFRSRRLESTFTVPAPE